MNREMAEIVRNQKAFILKPSCMVQEACRQMHTRRIGAVLVTDEHGKLIGIFTGRDAVRMLARGHDATLTTLSEVMTKNPATMAPRGTAIEALRLMRDGGFRHVPVVDEDGNVVGVVSRGDFRGLEHDRMDQETGFWEHMR